MRLAVLFFALVSSSFAQQEDLAAKSSAAKQMMAAGRFAEAASVYEELVRALPGNQGLVLNLGMAQHMAGRDREAIAQFDKVLKIQPDVYPALAMSGASYMRLGESAKAIGPLRKALAKQPGDTDLRRMLADALLMLDRHSEAAAELRKLADADPANPRIWYALGRSYEALAQSSFAQLEKTGSGSAWWLAIVAETRLKRDQNSSAFYFYKQALEKNPKLRSAHTGLAEVYRKTGHAGWAEVEEKREQALGAPSCRVPTAECNYRAGRFREAAAVQGNTAEALYWRIRACNALAVDAFSHLSQLPPSSELHQVRADVASGQGRYQDAIVEIKEAIRLTPDAPELQLALSRAVYMSRDYAAAEPMLRDLLRHDQGAIEVQFYLGDTLLNLQRAEEAVPLLEAASAMLPARAVLGRALMQIGKPEKAIPHLEAALSIDDDGSLLYQLSRAYQATGNAGKAKESLAKYQEIQKAADAAKTLLEKEALIAAPDPR